MAPNPTPSDIKPETGVTGTTPKHSDLIGVSVTTRGNLAGINQLITSLVSSDTIPDKFILRLEADIPAFDFYFEQLSAVLRYFNVEVHICIATSKGVHAARQWQLENTYGCDLLLLADDDVILRGHSLRLLRNAAFGAETRGPKWAYIQGTKWDITNRRGYRDFGLTRQPIETASNFNVPCVLSESIYTEDTKKFVPPKLKPCYWLDTGFVLLNVPALLAEGLEFIVADKHANCGGEDALFALQCERAGLPRFWCPEAEAIHLEKPSGTRFGEASYRKEAVLRTAELMGLPTDRIGEFLAYEPLFTHVGEPAHSHD